MLFCQKPPVAPPAKPAVTKAAAKSRLAAVKAAMKAKQQAEKTAQEAANTENQTSQEPQPRAEALTRETVVFDGGFFKVESPAKPAGESNGLGAICLLDFLSSFLVEL